MKLPSLKQIAGLFRDEPRQEQRGYSDLASVGGVNADWALNYQSEDADLWMNRWALTSRVRDNFKTNPYYISYRETFWANVYGASGIMLRSRVKEQEDRVIHTPQEKAAIREFEGKRNRLLKFYSDKQGRTHKPYNLFRDFGENGSRVAQVKVGEPDVFARKLIEEWWEEWQQAEFCDVRGTRNYKTIRQLRGISAVRDGDFFIRMIRDWEQKVNKFGFALQLINSEWCDHFYNEILPNGNVVRMGIEYEFAPWGLGKVVAYYFIKRVPRDWQYSSGFMGRGSMGRGEHDRVDAREIVYYARAVDADGTRPAPWVASTIPMSRHLDQYQISEVIAARIHASRLGWLTSTVMPEGGYMGELPDPQKAGRIEVLQGIGYKGLPHGIEVQETTPTHPNGNYPQFRQEGVRTLCAGMVGADYSTMANDYAAINFAAGRLQRLDKQELWKLIQTYDIDYAERPIFLAGLEMALAVGAIKLPMAKLRKFSAAQFSGRSWKGVDELKESTAAAMRVANLQSNDYLEAAAVGLDFDEIAEGQAEANMIKEMFGLKTEKTVESQGAVTANSEDSASAAESATIQGTALNGAQIEALLSIVNQVSTGAISTDAATALIAAAFPLMTPEEISAITDKLEEGSIEEDNETEATGQTNGARPTALETEVDEEEV